MLKGQAVDLRVLEREDIDFLAECFNDLDFWGEYSNPVFEQSSKSGLTKNFDNPPDIAILVEWKRFIVQKKDGTKIGFIWHFINQPSGALEIGCFLVPSERRKGHGVEATQLMVDYLFLSKSIGRIQAYTNVKNKTAQKVLEKAGFKAEGIIRKRVFVRGIWTDFYLLSILREEWKEPKILTKTA